MVYRTVSFDKHDDKIVIKKKKKKILKKDFFKGKKRKFKMRQINV